MEAGSSAVRVRRKKQARSTRVRIRRLVAALAAAVLAVAIVGLAYAGSSDRLAGGITIAGANVGGLSTDDAEQLLEARADRLANTPVVFTAGARAWSVRPSRLGIDGHWRAAVDDAKDAGDGFGPLRGLRRLAIRLTGKEVEPEATAWRPALAYRLRVFSRAIDDPHRDASLRLQGLHAVVVAGRDGRVLDRRAASRLVVSSLASFGRRPVALPVRDDRQRVTADDLDRVVEQAQTAVSAPVRLQLGRTRWRIPRWRIAKMLSLPHGGSTTLRIAGPGAAAFFRRLTANVDRPPRDADFAVQADGSVDVVPARDGRVVDVPATAGRLLAAALSPTQRSAGLVVVTKAPGRSTAEARALRIQGTVATYETIYGGDPNRIHNVQLVAKLIDRTLIAPGKEFSFNATTGERTPEKGFLEAPVIINGELQTGIGGGVCQVSTTVFNAAYEAGLRITARTNHALYIDHYPQGRDATVNYPDTDLRFVNDTGHWLLLRTFVGSSSLVVGLYGTPVHRRVESETAPLVETGPIPEKEIEDPTMYEGERVVEESGAPPRQTSVHRLVYGADGRLLYDDTWSSSYVAEPAVIRVGTKPKPKPVPPPAPSDSTTSTTETTPTAPDETTSTDKQAPPKTADAGKPAGPRAVSPRR